MPSKARPATADVAHFKHARNGGAQPTGVNEVPAAERKLLTAIENIDVLTDEVTTWIGALARSIQLTLLHGAWLEDAHALANLIEYHAGNLWDTVSWEAEQVGADRPIEKGSEPQARIAVASRFQAFGLAAEAEASHAK